MRIAVGAFMSLLMMIGLAKSAYDRYFKQRFKPATPKKTVTATIANPFTHNDWQIRLDALQQLDPSPDHIETLCPMLSDDDYDVRVAARDALAAIGEPALVALLDVLKQGNPEARQMSAEALGKMGDKSAISPLIETLNDESKWVRLAVVEALGNFNTQAARKALVQVRDNDDDNQVQEAVKLALSS